MDNNLKKQESGGTFDVRHSLFFYPAVCFFLGLSSDGFSVDLRISCPKASAARDSASAIMWA